MTSGGKLIHSWGFTGFQVTSFQRGPDQGKRIPFGIPRLPTP